MDGNKAPLVIPPIAFSRVADGIYRSAYPAPKSIRFMDSLQLKSIVALAPSDVKKELRDYCAKRDIIMCECNVGLNQEPFVTMSEKSVADAVDFMSDPTNHPVLVFCTTGRSKTSVVVGCYRRWVMGTRCVLLRPQIESRIVSFIFSYFLVLIGVYSSVFLYSWCWCVVGVLMCNAILCASTGVWGGAWPRSSASTRCSWTPTEG
jgi:hypothetical protein